MKRTSQNLGKNRITRASRTNTRHAKTSYYRFTDPDPDMQWVCERIIESGMSIGEIVSAVYERSNHGVTIAGSTIDKWLKGKTRRPQNFTLTWVALGLGYRKAWEKVEA